jgi:hypothetical protein
MVKQIKEEVVQARDNDHFLRFKVLVAISIRPSFASDSGNALIDAIALLAYSSARALVCSKPSLWRTNSLAYVSVSIYSNSFL